MAPKLGRALTGNLADVRVCVLRGEWVLVYVAHSADQRALSWVGWNPDTFGATRSPLWDAIPKPAQRFLTAVHAGFTDPDCESPGIVQPARTKTYAEWMGFDDAAEDWDQDGDYYVFPYLSPGKIALIYEGDIGRREDFGPALDNLMTSRFEASIASIEGKM